MVQLMLPNVRSHSARIACSATLPVHDKLHPRQYPPPEPTGMPESRRKSVPDPPDLIVVCGFSLSGMHSIRLSVKRSEKPAKDGTSQIHTKSDRYYDPADRLENRTLEIFRPGVRRPIFCCLRRGVILTPWESWL